MTDLEKLKQIFNNHAELPNWGSSEKNLKENNDPWSAAPSYRLVDEILVGLSFSGFDILKIPDEIFSFKSLETLVFADLPVSNIPDGIQKLERLKKLAFDSLKYLKEVPYGVFLLRNLDEFILRDCDLEEIPSEFGKLQNLNFLSLSGNKIKSISPEIKNLTKLSGFYFDQNRLEKFPSELTALTNLVNLNLSSNNIKALPFEITNLINLEELNLQGNQFQIPDNIYKKKPQEQIRYILNLQKQGAIQLNEGKMILLGDGAVGKTALVERLMHDTFSGKTEMTEGIDIKYWNIDEDITLNIWDFGGQEIMRAMHQFFMTPRTLYILVCTHRTDESDKQVEDWLRLIQAFGANSPVLIIKSKCDKHELNLDENRLQDLYPNIQGFFNTSAQNNTGIKELRNAIHRTLSHEALKHIKDLIPQNQIRVKEALVKTQKTENYIDLNRYYALCEANEVIENIEQLDLLRLLHDLGIAFNYGNKENPATTNVLKPEWVTKGIYAIINNNTLFQQEGKVHLRDLKNVLVPRKEYRGKDKVIMGLMDQFDLCFSLDKDTYLVPDLLPKKQPFLKGLFKDSLRLQYQYDLLPRSIMPQFISRMNELAQQYWLHGIIISEGENNGLIQVNYEKHKVSIFVNGEKNTRRNLLDKIRENFTILNDKIKGKNPEILVPLPDNPEITVSYDLLIQAERDGDVHVRVKDAGKVEVKPLLDYIVNDKERFGDITMKFEDYQTKFSENLNQTKVEIVDHIEQKEKEKKEKKTEKRIILINNITHLKAEIVEKEQQYFQFEQSAEKHAETRRNWYFGGLFFATIIFIWFMGKNWSSWGEPVSWAILLILGLVLYMSRDYIAPWKKYERDKKDAMLNLMHEARFNFQQFEEDKIELGKLESDLRRL